MTAISRIDNNRAQTLYNEVQQTQKQGLQRLEAYDQNESFIRDAEPSLISTGGGHSALPQEQQENMNQLLQNLSPEARMDLVKVGKEFSDAIISKTVSAVENGDQASEQVMPYVRRCAEITGAQTTEQLTMNSMMMGYMGVESELIGYAQKMNYNNQMKETLREEAMMMRDQLSDWPDGESREISYQTIEKQDDGSYVIVEKKETMTKEGAENLMKSLEEHINTVSDFSQLDMIDLQNTVQKEQQLMTMMSSMLKTIHDSAKGILQNLK